MALIVTLAGVGVGFWAWWALSQGRRASEEAISRPTPSQPEEVTFHWAEGEVKAVYPEIDRVVIAHGEIPGLMPAMTMGFKAEDPKLLAGLEAGDHVRVRIKATPQGVSVTGLFLVSKAQTGREGQEKIPRNPFPPTPEFESR